MTKFDKFMLFLIFSLLGAFLVCFIIVLINPQADMELINPLALTGVLGAMGFGFLWAIAKGLSGSFLFAKESIDVIREDLRKKYEERAPFVQYILDNSVKLGLFTRPVWNKEKIILANKYVVLNFKAENFADMNNYNIVLTITNKINGILTKYSIQSGRHRKDTKQERLHLFAWLCDNFSYKTTEKDVLTYFKVNDVIHIKVTGKKINQQTLDINSCSEAELTAISGMSIAKAKHAVKVRKKQMRFLNVKQFFEAIGFDEEFAQQVQVKGDKIPLSSLPEYQKLENKKENL